MNKQNSDFITKTRDAATKLLESIDELRALDKQRAALDLGTALDNGTRSEIDNDDIQFGDFQGANMGVTKNDILNVTTTLNAIEALLSQGHATNLYKVKK